MAEESASITVRRVSNRWADGLRAYEVVIDRRVVGQIRRGEAREFEVAAGPHEVFLKMDWCRSDGLALALAAGQGAVVDCSPRNPLGALYWITFGRSRYIKLTRTV